MTAQSKSDWDRFVKNAPKKAQRAVGSAMRQAGFQWLTMMDTVVPVVPVDTGYLRSSLRVDLNGRNIKSGGKVFGVDVEEFMLEGYGRAHYYEFVHTDYIRRYRRPGSGPNFIGAHMGTVARTMEQLIHMSIMKAWNEKWR